MVTKGKERNMEGHTTQKEWDIHFMKEAKLWMERSKCLSRQIGAVLVQGKHIIASGYNGPPRGIPHCDHRDALGNYVPEPVLSSDPLTDMVLSTICPRQRMGFKSGEGMEHCVAIHAEINPIMQAARMGIPTDGATLYCYCGTPCINCSKEIINAGIQRVVCLAKSGDRNWDTPIKDGDNPDKKEYNFVLAEKILGLAGVTLSVITEEEVVNG